MAYSTVVYCCCKESQHIIKNTVAELRQICETRGIEHDGLTKPRLIAALREADVRDGCDEEDVEDVGVEGADEEIQLASIFTAPSVVFRALLSTPDKMSRVQKVRLSR